MVAGGAAAWMAGRRPWASVLGASAGAIGAAVALVVATEAALSGRVSELRLAWPLPFGSFHVGFDGLSAFFAAVTALVCGLAAVYGVAYLKPHAARRSLGPTWFAFNLLTASMLVVAGRARRRALPRGLGAHVARLLLPGDVRRRTARDDQRRLDLPGRHAPRHGLPARALRAARPGRRRDMDFGRLQAVSPDTAAVCFVLALVGFGTKAGFVPLHVWLPEAHPAAPSHVSAVMSGVMIKTGIYGLLRVAHLPRTARALVGLDAGGGRRGLGRPRRALRPGPARPQAPARLPQRREHRDHRARPRPGAGRPRHGQRGAGRARHSPAGCCTS